MAAPRVTVVVPVHNAGAFLAPALDSVLAQTYRDLEVVVVDDASSDGSDGLIRAYAAAHPRWFRAVLLERNVGVAAARNAGIAASSGGELVALLDHDDRWHADYLERTVAAFDAARAAGRRVGIVACDALLEEDDRILGETYLDRHGRADRVDLDLMLRRNGIHARALFTREGYDAVGGFDPGCLASDDFDLWMRLLEAGWEVETLPEALVTWRLHPGSQSRDQRRMSEGAVAAYTRAIERGALSPAQCRAARRRVRHHRALLARARVHDARASGRPLAAAGGALRAAPYGVVAFVQAPSRWAEWLVPRHRSVL